MNKKRQIAFILTPHSGTHSKQMIPELIDKHLDKSKFDYQLLYTEHSGHAAEIALNCVEQQIDIVVAVGGDGTVNEVARALTETPTASYHAGRAMVWHATCAYHSIPKRP